MFNSKKIATLAPLILSLSGISSSYALPGDEDFYDKLKIQYVPEEIQKLFPKNQPIIAYAIGHLNDDSYWDAVVVTTTVKELEKAKVEKVLPTNKTVHLLLGDQSGFKPSLSHAHLFQDQSEPSDAVHNDIVSIQNHKISKMTHHTYQQFGDESDAYPATGGFEIRQSFANNNASFIGFIWDKKQQTWVYDGANLTVEIPNGVQLVSLSVDEETRYKLTDFYLGHPEKGNLINLDGQDYIDQDEEQ